MAITLTRLAENALAAGLVVGSGINNLIPTPNMAMSALKVGTTQIVAEDLVDYFTGRGSLILSMDYRNFADRVVFASGFVAGLNYSGATLKAIQLVDQVSPLGEMVNDALVNGGLIMLNRTVADAMDASTTFSQAPLVYLNHLSHILG